MRTSLGGYRLQRCSSDCSSRPIKVIGHIGSAFDSSVVKLPVQYDRGLPKPWKTYLGLHNRYRLAEGTLPVLPLNRQFVAGGCIVPTMSGPLS